MLNSSPRLDDAGLVSCDTFVVMGDSTLTGETIFGKNSDRPCGEIQEVVHIPAAKPGTGVLKCTYIEIDQASQTYSVILSKPEWMWGAEMGANEHGVVIGNEAVWNRLSDNKKDLVPRLLGMDLLRLGLERGKSARAALDVITDLLEKYGQGGQCSHIVKDFSYHNSFLIADGKEAWILETADKYWVAEHIVAGVRNISNCMSITTKIDLCHKELKDRSKAEGWWDGITEFNWCEVIGVATGDLEDPGSRYSCGRSLLQAESHEKKFTVSSMMKVLRDEPSGINRPSGSFPTAGSQVSILSKDNSVGDCHWFTATPHPSRSVFKPFSFSMPPPLTDETSSDSDKSQARKHFLWLHQTTGSADPEALTALELKYIQLGIEARKSPSSVNLFNKSVEEELDLYKAY